MIILLYKISGWSHTLISIQLALHPFVIVLLRMIGEIDAEYVGVSISIPPLIKFPSISGANGSTTEPSIF